jgi:hypothetical protein
VEAAYSAITCSVTASNRAHTSESFQDNATY